MPRSVRLQYPGAFYHVMARGNRRESIFADDDDRRFFLQALSEACGKTGWRIHAWVLMGNHYHLMLETPEPNLVDGKKRKEGVSQRLLTSFFRAVTLSLMPRSVRLQYPGAFYHVTARGNRREAIFKDDEDRRFFLHTLSEACGKTGWRIHAWVLMGNHYHLMLETPEPNLVDGMQWFQNTYTRRFNTRHRLWGRLFGDRYKAIPTEGRAGEYYCGLMDYLHLNPVRAHMIKPLREESLRDYPWSSAASGYALPPRRRPAWLAAADGLAAFGLSDTTDGRRRFIRRLDERAASETRDQCGVPPAPPDARGGHLRRGWYWGSQAFAEKLLELAGRALPALKNRTYRSSPLHQTHSLTRAEAIVREGLAAAGLTLAELPELRGNDPRKVAIAAAVWSDTHAPLTWLAERLHMRSPANVGQILRRARLAKRPR